MAEAEWGHTSRFLEPGGPEPDPPLRWAAEAASVNLGDYLRSHYQARRPEDLTIRQASEAIDDLKAAGVEEGS